MEYLLLLIGFTLLIFSGRLLIKSSVSVARRLNLSSFVIGLTIVAIGTSAPEFLVSLTGALKGHADVAVYNVVGSNISNVLLVLAIASMILPIPVRTRTVWIDGSIMLLFSLMVWLFVLDLRFSAREGALIFFLLVLYILASLYRSRRESGHVARTATGPIPERAGRQAAVFGDVRASAPGMKIRAAVLGVIAASCGLALGAHLLVDSAVIVAREFGLSERIISVSLIAVGTSIPELTTSVIAAFRKETDISIGNIIGSNIFNIGLVLGITAMVKPMEVNPLILSFDIFWFAGVAILLIVIVNLPPKSILSRWKGLSMLSVYLIYLYFILN